MARGDRVRPVPRSPGLAGYEGRWVALKDDVVVVSASSSVELARLVAALPRSATAGAVMQYVSPPVEGYPAWVVG